MRLVFPAGLILIAFLLHGCSPVVKTDAADGAGMTLSRSSSDAYREDQKIEARAADLIYRQFRVLIHVNVASFNRNVLISGEVPDDSTKATIGIIVNGIEGVRHVDNELVVADNSTLASRSNDSLITTNTKLRFARDKRINSDHIKVVTENGTVFLMGRVDHAEADAAAEIASTTSRVQRVVKLFEYTD